MPYLRSKKTCIFDSIPCGVWFWCQNISATTKGVWSIFLHKDLIHESMAMVENSASPSFIENSCPGENCLSKTEGNGAKTSLIYKECMPRPTKSRSGGVGGYACCVPGCYNNCKKQRRATRKSCCAKNG